MKKDKGSVFLKLDPALITHTPRHESSPLKTAWKIGLAVLVVFIILVVIAIIANSDDKSSIAEQIKHITSAEKLAILDAGGNVGKDDTKVNRIKVLLNILSDRFHEPVENIADITSRGQEALKDEDLSMTNLVILEEVNKMGKLSNTSYFDAVALYGTVQLK